MMKNLISTVKYHLGGGQFATVDPQSFGLDLRQYFIPSESREIHPTMKGIRLRVPEWNNLLSCVTEIKAAIPKLESTKCVMRRLIITSTLKLFNAGNVIHLHF